jgi:hypothetical protein
MSEELVKYENENKMVVSNQSQSIFLSMERFEFAKKVASMLASSSYVPDQFRGPSGVGNCMIMLNLSERLGVDIFGLMQTSYVVHGRPGFEAKLIIALFSAQTKLFVPPIRWEMKGDFPKGPDAACRAYAKDKKTGENLYGEWIDWELIKAEGWDKDKGSMKSKWNTMPGQMFRYRSASFFINAYEPGLKMGIMTVDELEDNVIDVTPRPARSAKDDAPPVQTVTQYEIKPDPIPDETEIKPDVEQTAEGGPQPQPPHQDEESDAPDPMTDKQRKMLFAKMKSAELSSKESKEFYDFIKPANKREASDFIDNFNDRMAEWQDSKVVVNAPEDPDEMIVCPETLQTGKRSDCAFCDSRDTCSEIAK